MGDSTASVLVWVLTLLAGALLVVYLVRARQR
jgi:hypothetical protein